jgi:hypothetical protein
MRKVAALRTPKDGAVRCMLFSEPDGVFVFLYSVAEDGAADSDDWFESVQEAESYSREILGVRDEDWSTIPDPPPGCQQDWIAPVRVKGREAGSPQWGQFERLDDDGIWKPVVTTGVKDGS